MTRPWCNTAALTAITTCVTLPSIFTLASSRQASAETLATATFDVDSYIFMGTTHDPAHPTDHGLPGLAVVTDETGGDINGSPHFVFSVIEFGDLSGIQTVANGGPNKYLTLHPSSLPAPTTIGISLVATDLISSTGGYPVNTDFPGVNLFPGNPSGNSTDRLEWYMNHIKGDDDLAGTSYIGGATHVGVLYLTALRPYSLDVTAIVDSWIDGSMPNRGFGLWGIQAPGVMGTTFEIASTEHSNLPGPRLTDRPIPEPRSILLVLLGALGWLSVHNRFRYCR